MSFRNQHLEHATFSWTPSSYLDFTERKSVVYRRMYYILLQLVARLYIFISRSVKKLVQNHTTTINKQKGNNKNQASNWLRLYDPTISSISGLQCQVERERAGGGKIQGDGRKLLDRFKLFWVTNNITIIKWDPYLPITAKISNKRWFLKYIFVFDCQFESPHVALWRLT